MPQPKPTRKQIAPNSPPASQVYGPFQLRRISYNTLPHRFRPGTLDPTRCYFCTQTFDDAHGNHG